jgi:hypothetical protein
MQGLTVQRGCYKGVTRELQGYDRGVENVLTR